MRILSLTLAGFGPFLDEQHVDFERFAEDGIFLITGKTGAGKSSILDAICFALYASVPRYESTQQRLRSDHCTPDDPTWVELEFCTGGVDYRVRRSPEYDRPKQRGEGFTRSPTTAELYRRVGDTWEGLAARPVDVGVQLAEIIGLTKDQFLQVILLAQNRFQQFLKAGNDDRQAVLRTLFATDRFASIENVFAERRKALEARLAGSRDGLAQLTAQFAALVPVDAALNSADSKAADISTALDVATEPWLDAGLAALNSALAVLTDDAQTADEAHSAADVRHRLLVTTRSQQLRRDAAAARLAQLTLDAESIDIDRATLAAARRAAAVWSSVTAARAADGALESARADESRALATWQGFGVESDDLALTVRDLTEQLGSLAESRADELRLPALITAVDTAQNNVRSLDDKIAEARAQLDELPATIEATTTMLTAARVEAGGEAAARLEVERLTAAQEQALLATTLEASLDTARAQEAVAHGAHVDAAAAHHTLLERRLAGHAAELAGELVDGEPCAVCGSTSHPAPATTASGPVTQLDIDEAFARAETLRASAAASRDTRAALDVSLAEAIARTDGRSADDIAAAVRAASDALAAAVAATAHATAVEAELTRLKIALDAGARSVDDLAAQRETATNAHATAIATRDDVERRVAESRGSFATVAERVTHLEAVLAAAETLEAAISATASRSETQQSAAAALEGALAEQSFASAAEVESARRDASEITTLETRIRDHDQGVATSTATLAEEELQNLPHEVVEVETAESAVAEARAARDASITARAAAAERLTTAASIADDARVRLATSAALNSEYEQLRELAQAVAGKDPNTMRMRLETYVLAAQLEEIVAAANVRLRAMTSGRFLLEHDDSLQYRNTSSGLGLAILDEHTGRSRATHSLSGGETFLASLALALGLAEVVTNQSGGITLDTLFIDEGFGSLDNDTLEIAMGTLDGLRAGGRTIGLISHVESMKEQILAKLRVSVDGKGHSTIETEVG